MRERQTRLRVHLLGYVALLVGMLLLAGCSRTPASQRRILVVFRYDDYSELSPTDLEVKLIEAFRSRHAACTFAVIPYVVAGDSGSSLPQDTVPLGLTKSETLRTAVEAGVVDVALHGYSHQSNGLSNVHSEFGGLDYGTQLDKIARAQAYLNGWLGTTVTTFVPPFDTYDLNTLRALETLGFKSISSNASGLADSSTALKYLPATSSLLQLRDAVASARTLPEWQPVVVALIHAYDFLELDAKRGEFTYPEFLQALDWVTSQPDVRVLTLSQAGAAIDDLGARRLRTNQWGARISSRLVPPWVRQAIVPDWAHVYISSSTLFVLVLRVLVFYLAGLVLSACLAFAAGRWLFPRSSRIASLSRHAVLVLTAALLIYAFRDLKLTYRGAIVIAASLGASAGVWWAWAWCARRGMPAPRPKSTGTEP